jgi:hypothetical protein
MDEARGKMMEIAGQLLVNSQADIKAGGISVTKRDLLSLLVQSNATRGIQEDQRLNDTDVIARTSFFRCPDPIPIEDRLQRFLRSSSPGMRVNIFQAAPLPPNLIRCTHLVSDQVNLSIETSLTGWTGASVGIATALALRALSLHPSVQSKLREELLSIATDDPTMDELNSCPYLENVVREVMRVYPPVAFSRREAMEDDVLPLSKPYLDRNGNSYDTISYVQIVFEPGLPSFLRFLGGSDVDRSVQRT